MYKPIKHKLGANAGELSWGDCDPQKHSEALSNERYKRLLRHVNDAGESGLCSHFHLIKDVDVGH